MNTAQLNYTIIESVRTCIQKQTSHRPEICPLQYLYYNSGPQNATVTAEDARASIEVTYTLGAKGLVASTNKGYPEGYLRVISVTLYWFY